MNNSRPFGPLQVRDLSESWGEDTQSVKTSPVLTSGLPEALVCPTVPTAESHYPASAVLELRSPLHRALPLHVSWINGSLASHTAGIGARFSRVKGSTPSTVTFGDDYRPDYITPVVQRLDTVAV